MKKITFALLLVITLVITSYGQTLRVDTSTLKYGLYYSADSTVAVMDTLVVKMLVSESNNFLYVADGYTVTRKFCFGNQFWYSSYDMPLYLDHNKKPLSNTITIWLVK